MNKGVLMPAGLPVAGMVVAVVLYLLQPWRIFPSSTSHRGRPRRCADHHPVAGIIG